MAHVSVQDVATCSRKEIVSLTNLANLERWGLGRHRRRDTGVTPTSRWRSSFTNIYIISRHSPLNVVAPSGGLPVKQVVTYSLSKGKGHCLWWLLIPSCGVICWDPIVIFRALCRAYVAVFRVPHLIGESNKCVSCNPHRASAYVSNYRHQAKVKSCGIRAFGGPHWAVW